MTNWMRGTEYLWKSTDCRKVLIVPNIYLERGLAGYQAVLASLRTTCGADSESEASS